MNSILKSHYKSGKFGHGYLFYGDRESALEEMGRLARRLLGVNLSAASFDLSGAGENNLCRGHLDFYGGRFKKFGVEDARGLKDKAYKKPLGGPKKVFLLDIESFSREAENALLKMFEEPPLGTYFLIFTPYLQNLLGTLKSRLIPVYIKNIQSQSLNNITEFFKMEAQDKLNFLEKMKSAKEKSEVKNLFLEFIGFLEDGLKKNLGNPGKLQETALKIKKLEKGLDLLEQNMPTVLITNYVYPL